MRVKMKKIRYVYNLGRYYFNVEGIDVKKMMLKG